MNGGLDPRVTWTVDYIRRHLAEPLTIRVLAGQANLSPSRFRALFVVQTGVAPMRYLQRARLRRARILLERTFLSVKDVMALVGYSDPSHFARDFRREHGAPPGEIRAAGDPESGSPSLDPP